MAPHSLLPTLAAVVLHPETSISILTERRQMYPQRAPPPRPLLAGAVHHPVSRYSTSHTRVPTTSAPYTSGFQRHTQKSTHSSFLRSAIMSSEEPESICPASEMFKNVSLYHCPASPGLLANLGISSSTWRLAQLTPSHLELRGSRQLFSGLRCGSSLF